MSLINSLGELISVDWFLIEMDFILNAICTHFIVENAINVM